MIRYRGPATAAEREELASILGAKPHVLAWGSGPDTLVAGLSDAFAVRTSGEWVRVGYHEIVRGGWRKAEGVLWWIDPDDVRHEVPLTDPGRFAELFVERVSASIMIDRVVGEPGFQARLVARRDLADPDAPLSWRATPVGLASVDDPAFDALVTAGIDRLRRDYGIG